MALVLSLIAFVSTILLMNPSSADVYDPIAFTSVSAQESPAPMSDCGVTPDELASVSGNTQALVIQSGGITNGESISMPLILTSAPNGLAGYFLEVILDNPAAARIVGVDFPEFGLTRIVSKTGSAIQFAAADLMVVVQSNASHATIATLQIETMSEGSTTFHVKAF
jgi:hypothetical protein